MVHPRDRVVIAGTANASAILTRDTLMDWDEHVCLARRKRSRTNIPRTGSIQIASGLVYQKEARQKDVTISHTL